ncbi:mannose-1-phosphate guanylyltransferase/mannose-6-phosphate isomerase [Maricaulis sp.]|uniref:mannose-1-phosphate guanylyltransferase/mannose-6-phosphate isomerase n=1 Tax=Maricaulis sp. TaxID=1486257 RepID=UPI002B2723A9|nr:mannose-1-phosphate guanylyltransferase/mannose-6-phosphate isomerase [Maricaulis sp.]
MTTRILPVIMSGGSGTRLWPLSREDMPKQLQALTSDASMLVETARRVAGEGDGIEFLPPLVILNAKQVDTARAQLAGNGFPEARFVVEPVGRNTAAVAAAAAELAKATDGADLVLLLPADHFIRDVGSFRSAIGQGSALARSGRLVTFGIEPDQPHTGYGYIRRGDASGPGFDVRAFTEKPDAATATDFLRVGGYYWNAGIFLFAPDAVIDEMHRQCPDVLAAVRKAISGGHQAGVRLDLEAGAFARCPSISFDYAVMEGTDRAAVVPADIGWSDVGSFDALWQIRDKDSAGNAGTGDVNFLDARRCFGFATDTRVVLCGVRDLVVVQTRDAVLVADRNDSQAIKSVVEQLKAEGRTDLL